MISLFGGRRGRNTILRVIRVGGHEIGKGQLAPLQSAVRLTPDDNADVGDIEMLTRVLNDRRNAASQCCADPFFQKLYCSRTTTILVREGVHGKGCAYTGN